MPPSSTLRTFAVRGAVAVLLAGAAAFAAWGEGGDDLGQGGVVRAEPADEAPAAPDASGRVREPGMQRANVTRVIDGDTLDARLVDSGTVVRVRLLGIDAPEKTELRAGRAECGGQEATAAARALMRRRGAVDLRTDPGQDREDRYGRLLAYVDVALDPGVSYQSELLRQGWVKVYSLPRRPIARRAAFDEAAAQARQAGSGIWKQCGGDFRKPLP